MKTFHALRIQLNESVSYTAVVLDQSSQETLVAAMKHHIPDGWKVYCHHMTINMGPYKIRSEVGKRVALSTVAVARNDSIVAVSVQGYPSDNKHPHITVAVNTALGAKPKDSNLLTKWYSMYPIRLMGTVTEVS